MATGRPSDPLPAFRFRVEIDAAGAGALALRIEAACSDCSGLHAETETVEYREGGRNDFTHRFRGQTRYPPLVLKRGLTGSSDFWDWYAATAAGAVTRRDGAIWLLDSAGHERKRWDFFGAYPTKWAGPDLRAEAASLGFESVELVHRGFTMTSMP
jgi:phage tail-like protein